MLISVINTSPCWLDYGCPAASGWCCLVILPGNLTHNLHSVFYCHDQTVCCQPLSAMPTNTHQHTSTHINTHQLMSTCICVDSICTRRVHHVCVLWVYYVCIPWNMSSLCHVNLVPPQLILQFLQTLLHFLQSRLQSAGITHLRTSFIHLPHL